MALKPQRKTFRHIQYESIAKGKQLNIAIKKSWHTTRILSAKLHLKSPSPSLAGQTVIVKQAVLLAPDHYSSAPSQGLSPSDISMQIHSLLQWRDRAGVYRLPY